MSKNVFDYVLTRVLSEISSEPTLVYIAVGCAALRTELKDGVMHLDRKLNQQYPIFIQNAKLANPEMNVICILIDKYLKSDTFMVKSKYITEELEEIKGDSIVLDDAKNMALLDDGWFQEGSVNLDSDVKLKIYNDYATKNTVYSIYDYVSYASSDNNGNHDDNYDITEFVTSIVAFNIVSSGSTVFHDFSGKDFRDLSKYVYDSHPYDLDRVVIGLGFGETVGCSPDLSDIMYNVYFNIRKNSISVMNPHQFNSPIEFIQAYTSHPKDNPFRVQLRRRYISMKKEFYDSIFTLGRQMILLSKSTLENSDYMHHIYLKSKDLYGNFEYEKDAVLRKVFEELTIILTYIKCNNETDMIFSKYLSDENVYNGTTLLKNECDELADKFFESV